MKQETLIQLSTHQSYPCVAIFMETHRLTPERYTDKHRVKEILNRVKYQLVETNSKRTFDLTEMLIRLEDLLYSVDFNHQRQGLGIYLSPKISTTLSFPFTPKERVVLNHRFPLREIYYLNQLESSRYLMNLHEDAIHLFEINGEQIEEIHDGKFPMFRSDDYEYEPSIGLRSHGNFWPTSFEKERSFLEEKRIEQFFRTAENEIKQFRDPVFVMGEKQLLHEWIEMLQNKDLMKGQIATDLRPEDPQSILKKFREYLEEQTIQMENDLNLRLNELIGNKLLATDLINCWNQAHLGNGRKLFIEHDHFESGYLSNDEELLKRRNIFRSPKYERINDMTDKLILEVVSKGGSIYFTKSGKLKDLGKVALELRYPI